jgi:hypothetical protein
MTIGFQVTFDCHDPDRLGRFWAVALGYSPEPPPDPFTTWEEFADAYEIPPEHRNDMNAVLDPEGRLPRLLFQKVPEGKTAKNRVHLDINAGAGLAYGPQRAAAVDGHVRRCVQAGATVVAEHDNGRERHVVLRDPEGNEFCVQ